MRRYWICATRTGVKQLEVFPAAGSFSRVLNGAGRGSHTFVLAEGEPMRNRALSDLWNRVLVVEQNEKVLYAGVINNRTYTPDKRTLTVDHVDIRTLFQKRYPFGVQSYWADYNAHLPGRLVCANLSLRAIAARVVNAGLVGPYPIWSLPIVVGTSTEVGPFTQVYENYNFITVADALQDLQERDGGPDIDFEPRWSLSGDLEWLMRVGSPTEPSISGSTFEFNMSAEKPRLTDVRVTDNGTKMVTGMISVGAGSEADMRVDGWGFADGATIPALDGIQTFKQETSEPVLLSMAIAAATKLSKPTTQYEMSFLGSEQPGIANLKLGSILRLWWVDDPWVADGAVDLRLISFSGNETDKFVLDVQPWP